MDEVRSSSGKSSQCDGEKCTYVPRNEKLHEDVNNLEYVMLPLYDRSQIIYSWLILRLLEAFQIRIC